MGELKVGDIVIDRCFQKGVVSRVKEDSIYVIWYDGSCGEHLKDEFVRTGRVIDIAGLLVQIGGAEQ